MTEAGDAIKAAIERHRASVDAAQQTASALAVERERAATEAATGNPLGSVAASDSDTEPA